MSRWVDESAGRPGETRVAGPDPHATLGVDANATSAEVRIAYLQKVREHPPERDPEGFKRVREAYEALRSPRRRAESTLLELRPLAASFDPQQLRDAPPPPFPARCVDHLIAVALADLDATIDAMVKELRG